MSDTWLLFGGAAVLLVWLVVGFLALWLCDCLSREWCLVWGLERDAFSMWYYRTKLIRRPGHDDGLDEEVAGDDEDTD